jgi:hypothetical protein
MTIKNEKQHKTNTPPLGGSLTLCNNVRWGIVGLNKHTEQPNQHIVKPKNFIPKLKDRIPHLFLLK